MEIKVIVEAAPELMTAIDTLTATLVELVGTKEKTKPANSAKLAPAVKTELTDKPVDQPTFTLETVRAKLAALSQSGKQKEVKAIIESFGVKKLTDIPAEHYPTVMALAAKLEAES
jgi:hypothetical protein